MKIGFDITPLKSAHKYRGTGSYTEKLVSALKKHKPQNKYILFTRTGQLPKNVDLVHFPFFDPFFLTLPLFKPYKTVVTVHDLTPLVFPDKFLRGIKGEIKWQIQKKSLGGVSAIITDSKNSKRDIVRLTHFPQEKIYVVPLAPGEQFRLQATSYPGKAEDPRSKHRDKLQAKTRRKYSLPERFILYVGDVNWNKNIPGLIKAFHKLKAQSSRQRRGSPKAAKLKTIPTKSRILDKVGTTKNLKLALVGKAFLNEKLRETREINQLIDKLNIKNTVLRLGFVPTQDLVAIYSLATVYCQPSFYEGFGLPPLEAMACGVPVVAADIPTLKEVCGKAAIYVTPDDPVSIKEGIEKVLCLNDLNHLNMVKRGFEQVNNFSWKKTAEETVKVYEKTIQS